MNKLLLILSLIVPLGFTGCSTLPERPAQTVTLDTFRSLYSSTRELYKSAVRLDEQGKVKPGDMADVDQAWNRFREAMQLAVRAAGNNWNAPAPESVIQLHNDIWTLVKSL